MLSSLSSFWNQCMYMLINIPTLLIKLLLVPLSNCIRTAKWVKWLQLHSVWDWFLDVRRHPCPDQLERQQKTVRRAVFRFQINKTTASCQLYRPLSMRKLRRRKRRSKRWPHNVMYQCTKAKFFRKLIIWRERCHQFIQSCLPVFWSIPKHAASLRRILKP